MQRKVSADEYKKWQKWCEQVQQSTGVKPSETKAEQDKRKKRSKKDFKFFGRTYFPIYTDSDFAYFHDEFANAVLADPNFFGAAEWPREHAKTVVICLLIVLWLLINDELDGLILMSRTEDMAINILGDLQAVFEYNELFKHDWGDFFNYGDWAAGDFTIKGGIRFLALGRGQAPQGARKGEKRPNLGICSDLDDYEIVQNEKRVLQVVNVIMGALMNALALKGSRMIIENNRIHPRGILAHIVGDITPNSPKREGLYHSKVFATESAPGVKAYISEGGRPAWKERYTNDELQRRFKKIGPTLTSAEFYHEHAVEGRIFKNELFKFKKLPHLTAYKVIIGYFDPSFENKPTSDFKAWSAWGGYVNELGQWERHCLKRFTRRAELSAAFSAMSAFEETLPPGVAVIWYVEKQFYNRPIQDALFTHNKGRKKKLIIITDNRAKENKYSRIVRMEPAYTNDEVYYSIDELHNTDMIEGNNQVKGIEPGYGGSDDAPDSDEGAWYYLDQHIPGRDFKPIIGKHKRKR